MPLETLKPSPTSPHLAEIGQGDLGDRRFIAYHIATSELGPVGDIRLEYSPHLGRVSVGAVYISKPGQGTGKAVYRQVPHLTMPDGQTFAKAGYKFESSRPKHAGQLVQMEGGEALWRSLERDGDAVLRDDGIYELVTKPTADRIDQAA